MSERWSYQVIPVKPGLMGGYKYDEIQAELNRQGALGWELVQAVSTAPMSPVMLMFKRRN